MISEFSGFNSNYNATLNLRNTGSVAITLSSYYVKDSAGNQWARTGWSTAADTAANHPAAAGIAPNGLGVVFILIGTAGTASGQCNAASCTSTGTAFTFANAGQYTVLIVTSRNNQFTFTVTR
jgi:hypothetical protein